MSDQDYAAFLQRASAQKTQFQQHPATSSSVSMASYTHPQLPECVARLHEELLSIASNVEFPGNEGDTLWTGFFIPARMFPHHSPGQLPSALELKHAIECIKSGNHDFHSTTTSSSGSSNRDTECAVCEFSLAVDYFKLDNATILSQQEKNDGNEDAVWHKLVHCLSVDACCEQPGMERKVGVWRIGLQGAHVGVWIGSWLRGIGLAGIATTSVET